MTRPGVAVGWSAAALAGLAILLVAGGREAFVAVRIAVGDLGNAGPVVVALAYGLLSVALVPGAVLSVGCGLLFGLRMGIPVAVIGSNLGAALGFVAARTLLRERAKRLAARHLGTAVLAQALARDPFKWTLMLRLSPVFPFSILNLVLGASGLAAGPYLGATVLGMLPATLLFVGLGSTCTACLAQPAGWEGRLPWQLGALAVVTLAVGLMTIRAGKAVRQAAGEDPRPA